MKKNIDAIRVLEDGRFDLEGFTNTDFSRIKALAVVIADPNSEASKDEQWALIEVLRDEVLEVERYLRKWIDESLEKERTIKAA